MGFKPKILVIFLVMVIALLSEVSYDTESNSVINNIVYAETGEGAKTSGIADKVKDLEDTEAEESEDSGEDSEDSEDSEEGKEEDSEKEDSEDSEGGEESGESSGGTGNNRGEKTGNLEYDPFTKNGPVQNTTGVKTGDEGNIQSTDSFVVGQWIYVLLDIIMIGILVLLAGYIVLMGVVVLLITFYSPMIANNKLFSKLLGEKTMEGLAHDGVRGVWKSILVNFLLGAFLLMLAVTGYVNGIQVIILEFFVGIFK